MIEAKELERHRENLLNIAILLVKRDKETAESIMWALDMIEQLAVRLARIKEITEG